MTTNQPYASEAAARTVGLGTVAMLRRRQEASAAA
jgi:hypothetical protein